MTFFTLNIFTQLFIINSGPPDLLVQSRGFEIYTGGCFVPDFCTIYPILPFCFCKFYSGIVKINQDLIQTCLLNIHFIL